MCWNIAKVFPMLLPFKRYYNPNPTLQCTPLWRFSKCTDLHHHSAHWHVCLFASHRLGGVPCLSSCSLFAELYFACLNMLPASAYGMSKHTFSAFCRIVTGGVQWMCCNSDWIHMLWWQQRTFFDLPSLLIMSKSCYVQFLADQLCGDMCCLTSVSLQVCVKSCSLFRAQLHCNQKSSHNTGFLCVIELILK